MGSVLHKQPNVLKLNMKWPIGQPWAQQVIAGLAQQRNLCDSKIKQISEKAPRKCITVTITKPSFTPQKLQPRYSRNYVILGPKLGEGRQPGNCPHPKSSKTC